MHLFDFGLLVLGCTALWVVYACKYMVDGED